MCIHVNLRFLSNNLEFRKNICRKSGKIDSVRPCQTMIDTDLFTTELYCSELNLQSTCVSAFVEIHQSWQCKIFQYTFLRQYPNTFWYFLSLCKIQQSALRQLDYKKLGPSEMRFSDPYVMKLKKHALVWHIHLWKTLTSKFIEFKTYQEGWENLHLYLQTF